MIITEDGATVNEGDRVYNYYDMKPGKLVVGSIEKTKFRDEPFNAQRDLWFYVEHDDGSNALLNGQRICSMPFARMRGFKGA